MSGSPVRRVRSWFAGRVDGTDVAFDAEFYAAANTDLRSLTSRQARRHWIEHGRTEGRFASPASLAAAFESAGLSFEEFEPEFYLSRYPELVQVGIDTPEAAAVHYVRFGASEGRVSGLAQHLDHREIMGVRVPTLDQWRRLIDLDGDQSGRARFSARPIAGSPQTIRRSPDGSPSAAVLVSLYRSIDHLDMFIGNLLEQTAFAECDICIVAVDPEMAELDILQRFADSFDNVMLRVERKRITVYRAWNLAMEMSAAPLLTNANADDLRSPDSFEVQIAAFGTRPDVDVIYQDVLLTVDPSTPWSAIERADIRIAMPPVTRELLLGGFNAPHNAPMWRRSLHDELGGFDETFQSAGDWEFWIRCATAGRRFERIDASTVAYFVNEQGLSRRIGGPGYLEVAAVMERHSQSD